MRAPCPRLLFALLSLVLPLRAVDLPAGYRLVENYSIDSGHSSLRLQLLLDTHLTDDLVRDWWGTGRNLPDASGSNDELGVKLHPTLVRLVNCHDRIVALHTFPRALAKLTPCPPLTRYGRPAFALSIDRSLTWGTYFGPATFLFVPDATGLGEQAVVTNEQSRDIALTTSPRTRWQVIPSFDTCDIVEVTCATVVEFAQVHLDRPPDYTVSIRRFHLDHAGWHSSTTQRYGYRVDDTTDPDCWLQRILAENKLSTSASTH